MKYLFAILYFLGVLVGIYCLVAWLGSLIFSGTFTEIVRSGGYNIFMIPISIVVAIPCTCDFADNVLEID